MPLGEKGSSQTRRRKRGTPLKGVILPLLARLTWKWLQIGIDMLLIITSTGDELLRNVNIDDLEWPWTSNIGGLSEFFAILACDTRFTSELRQNGYKFNHLGYAKDVTVPENFSQIAYKCNHITSFLRVDNKTPFAL